MPQLRKAASAVNLKFEIHLFLDEEQFGPEEIARLGLSLSDWVVEQGYGNIAAEQVEDTCLTSVIVIKPSNSEEWQDNSEEAMGINFPTQDERFIFQADEGGIIE